MTKYFRVSLLNSTKLFTVLGMILIIAALSGCSPSEKHEPPKAPAVSDIAAKIQETVDLSEMNEADGQKLTRLYGINSEDVEEYWIMVPGSNIKAQEIAVIKAKDSDKAEEIVEKLQARVERQANSFKDYIPDEYFLIQNHVLKSQGNYVFLVISEESDEAEKIFDSFFK